MDKKLTIVTILVGILLIVSVVQFFQLNGIKSGASTTGAVTATATNSIDMTGWTEDERMNYEMHGIIPARVNEVEVNPAGASMVGGC